MGRRFTLTKKQVIRALKTERLTGGAWVDMYGALTREEIVNKDNCSVCAVGAVLRHAFEGRITGIEIDAIGSKLGGLGRTADLGYASDVIYIIAGQSVKRHPLLGLSQLFETLYFSKYQLYGVLGKGRGPKMRALKKGLVTFVKKHFPEKFSITI